nr:putative late blight resistance protein homolog R1B-16 isoform X1 [Ipomoea batatas]
MNPNNHIGRLENLKKLVFCDITCGWKTVNILSKLPKLEVLKLLSCFHGEEWKLSKKEKFEQLIYLKIHDAIGLKCWEASAYHFPNLECLILSWCSKLEEIPANFAEISNLKSIKLIRCLPSAVASANQIWEEQHEQGNHDMIVIEEDTIRVVFLISLALSRSISFVTTLKSLIKMRLKSLRKCESRQPPANSRDRMGFQGLQFTDSSSFAPVSVQILELGGLEDEEVFLFPEDLAVGDDYYPGSGEYLSPLTESPDPIFPSSAMSFGVNFTDKAPMFWLRFSILVVPDVGGVKERDAGVNGVVDEGDHVGVGLGRAVEGGHAHTAQSLS